jgi:cyanophycinase-like exopeptidase
MPKLRPRPFVAIALLALAASTTAERTATAQDAGAERAGRISVLRVQSTVSLFVPGNQGSLDEQKAAGESGRRAVYEMAARECQVLVEVFRADCKLVSVNVNVNAQTRTPGSEGLAVNGTIAYELTSKPN